MIREPTDEELLRAATTLVRTALRVGEGERLAVVGDGDSLRVLKALENAGLAARAEVTALRLEQHRSYSTNHSGERPHKVLPDAVRRAMLASQASAFVATAPHGEAPMREQLLHCVGACRIRHAHLPGISPIAFAAGLDTDCDMLADRGRALMRKLEDVRYLETTDPQGTNLSIRLADAASHPRWTAQTGRVRAGEVAVFPTGSLIASPESVNGRFVATTVGEFFGDREGVLREPLTLDIENGVVRSVSCPSNPHLVRDVMAMLEISPGSERVGLVVLGLNPGIVEPVGLAAIDQLRPGLHLVIGDPLPRITGATWSARTSFAVCQSRGVVTSGGSPL